MHPAQRTHSVTAVKKMVISMTFMRRIGVVEERFSPISTDFGKNMSEKTTMSVAEPSSITSVRNSDMVMTDIS